MPCTLTDMKRFIILLIFILGKNLYFSQTGVQGLYKNSNDFLNSKIAFSESQTHIRLHELFKKKTVIVKYNDSSYTFLKSELYGYMDKQGNSYRFYKDEIYLILNRTKNILLYKRTSGTGMKNSPIVETYFFSKDAGSLIYPLTLANIAKVFSNVPAFTKLVEIRFHYDDDLTEFDTLHNTYRINHLLEIATNDPIKSQHLVDHKQ